MLSHCLNDVCSDSLQSMKENAQPEVFLEQESSKVFFNFIASDVQKLLFSCAVRVIKLSCLFKRS